MISAKLKKIKSKYLIAFHWFSTKWKKIKTKIKKIK